MDGASVLINTYWVRFPRGKATFEKAVQNTIIMLRAAEKAGVKRIVHVSIANPSPNSPLGYYKGKAALEEAIRASRLSYSILRPTVIFGREDTLINNIAWFVRHFPFFGMPGDGEYKLQPIHVGDLADLIVSAAESDANYILDAVGPEICTFDQLVTMIANAINRSTRIVHLPVWLCYIVTRIMGWGLRDVILTWEEYKGLMGNLLVSDADPPGKTRLSQWLVENREVLGVHYASEVARHFR
jgi:NADH dehydrogenase